MFDLKRQKPMMKYFRSIRSGLLAAVIFTAIPLFTACEDDIDVGPGDSDRYGNVEGVYGYVKNVTGTRELSTLTLFGSGTATAQVYFELSETAASEVSVQFKVDKSILDAYNTANGTSYEMYPSSSVTFANNGSATVAANKSRSDAVNVTISAGGTIGTTYALPVTAEVSNTDVTLSKTNESYIFLVKPHAAIPDSDKGAGIKNVIYIEVNDENILNVGEYTMRSSGKPFFDVVNIFAANINYNSETGRVYVNCNDNVSYILRNADTFIRPLQAKGIKVILTILGNHDEAGVANLSPEAAADFACELKQYMDIYGLDGVDFDDEYSKYDYENPGTGLVAPSGAASARLVYECRKAMPDKIISFYDYTANLPAGTVEGIQAGELIDYSYWGAYANWNGNSYTRITGLGKAKYGPSSFNLDYSANNGGYDLSHVYRLRTEGWGIQMFYNLKPRNYDYSSQFNKLGRALFDDDVEWTGVVYEKTAATGAAYIPTYGSYLGTWAMTPSTGVFWYAQGPWWDWTSEIKYTLRIEEDEPGKTYKVYGWGVDTENLPFILNYNKYGRVEINLPQTVTEEIDGGKKWTWLARTSYNYRYTNAIKTTVEPAFQGYINSSGAFTIQPLKDTFTTIRTLQPVSDPTITSGNYDIKGGVLQNFPYAPFTLSK
jgi:hypothetical protein